MSPGSLSFVKLVMMSSAPAKSAGGARYASQDPYCPIRSRLQTQLGVGSYYVERKKTKKQKQKQTNKKTRAKQRLPKTLSGGGLVSKETVVLRRRGSRNEYLVLSRELIR